MAIRASAATCDITPDDGTLLAGFTGQRRVSDGCGYPLCAAAVHIRGGAGGIIILSLDLYSLDPSTSQTIRKRIASATGTREENIFVAATGCSSAPFTEHALYLKNDPSFAQPDEEYIDHVIEMSVKAASEAAVSSRPASVAVIHLDTPGTGAFIIKGENGRVIAATIVHNDVPNYLGPDNMKASSDFVGALREKLTSRFGGDPVIAYIPAPSGDQLLEERQSYGDEEATTAGHSLADLLVSKLKTLKAGDFLPNCSVGGKLLDLYSLPRRDLPTLADASALLNAATTMGQGEEAADDPNQRKLARWALIEANRTMSMVMAFKEGILETSMQDYDPVYIQSMTVGPLTIVGLPCTVLGSCAQSILSQAGPGVWLAQAINGTMMGSVLTCSGDQGLEGRLLSSVFEREVAGRLLAEIQTMSSGE